MADLKISQLTGASTPLAGTEVLPIVQSGSTKQVSVANLTAGRAVSAASVTANSFTQQPDANGIITLGRYSAGYPRVIIVPNATATAIEIRDSSGNPQVEIAQATGNVTFVTGNLTPATAAKGINFTANTPAAGMTSQLLNWYEEGTFTPTVIGTTSAGTASYAMQKGVYTRIGNVVYFYIGLNWNSGTGTGNLRMSGLPFTTRNDSIVYNAVTIGGVSDLTLPAGTYLTALTLPNTNTITFLAAVVGPGGTTTAVAYDASAEIECSGFYFI